MSPYTLQSEWKPMTVMLACVPVDDLQTAIRVITRVMMIVSQNDKHIVGEMIRSMTYSLQSEW